VDSLLLNFIVFVVLLFLFVVVVVANVRFSVTFLITRTRERKNN
jgi:hypothetical protein